MEDSELLIWLTESLAELIAELAVFPNNANIPAIDPIPWGPERFPAAARK